ncbi:hypothetical protein MKEN_00044700 [Mycena kentingensis (nom. inval.)]|nr:hypothetical protein MKEN_00044700 [Mycena kentingensis (nom. inval.)]
MAVLWQCYGNRWTRDRDKLPRHSSVTAMAPDRIQASSSNSPTKKPTSKKTKNPGLRKRQAEWKQQLPSPWTVNEMFTHPPYTSTVATKAAKADYHLTDEELRTLPHETRPSDHIQPMKLYSSDALFNLARDKSFYLKTPLVVCGITYHTDPGPAGTASGSVAAISIAKPKKELKWMEDERDPQPPPLVVSKYEPPAEAENPDPPNIIWTSTQLPKVGSESDACRAYCVEPSEIADLVAASHWIHFETVSKRAVNLHGGFHAHRDFVKRRRNEEKQQLQKKYEGTYDTEKSDFEWSPHVRQFHESCGSPRTDVNRVAVHLPIERVCMDDYGTEWEWLPSWGYF